MAKPVCENCGKKIKQGGRMVQTRNGIRHFCCVHCEKEALGENDLPNIIGGIAEGFFNAFLNK